MESIKDDVNSAVPRYFLGHAYLDLNESEKALNEFTEAARLEPHTAKLYVGLGFAYYKMKNYREAFAALQHAQALDPNADELLSGLGAVYAQLRDYKKAEAMLRAALEREPDHLTNHYNLGMVCVLRKNRNCALSEYNYLRMKGESLANKLFTGIYSDKVIDASAYQSKSRP